MEILGTQEEDWDCQRVLIDAVPTGSMNKDPSQWRGVQDFHYTGKHANFKWNLLEQDELSTGLPNPISDWVLDLDNSFINCKVNGNNMDCPAGDELTSGVTTRWTRKWDTLDEPTSDATISHETGGIQRKFFAFVNQYKNVQAPEDNSVKPDFITKTWSTSNVKITPVMPVWQEKWESEEK